MTARRGGDFDEVLLEGGSASSGLSQPALNADSEAWAMLRVTR
jgi:hypothetical protein